MDRREFIKTCSAVAAASLASPSLFTETLHAQSLELKTYKKALLVDSKGAPINPEKLETGREYIFFYPYRATPCILINLEREIPPTEVKLSNGATYRWNGGVGPRKSIVAYCAICPHQMSYPTPEYSFINYYPKDKPSKIVKRGEVIQCCAHMSVFDPTKGGQVMDGPAHNPLTAIVLSYEEGKLFALGTLGKELYEDFFDVFKPELRKLYKSTRKAKKLVETCKVLSMEDYTSEIIRC